MWLFELFFPQFFKYVEVGISRSILESPFDFEITIGCIAIGFRFLTTRFGTLLPIFQAKLTYQDAIAQGSTAMLLKEDDTAGDIFQCTLGNLPPKTDAKIRFSYVIELPQEPDGKIRFTLPTVLNPRYSPGNPTLFNPFMPNELFYVFF